MEALLRGRLRTFDTLVLTSLDQQLFISKIILACVAKQAFLIRRPIVLSLALFP
jgi:hypothetical protein